MKFNIKSLIENALLSLRGAIGPKQSHSPVSSRAKSRDPLFSDEIAASLTPRNDNISIGRLFALALLILPVFLLAGCGKARTTNNNIAQAVYRGEKDDTVVAAKPAELAPVPVDSDVYQGTTPVPILMYHYVREMPPADDKVGQGLTVTPADFDKQMNYLQSAGYTAIDFKTLRSGTVPAKPIILTFDDGYSSMYTSALPILEKYNFKATFYVITDFVGRDQYITWDQIKKMAAKGMTFGDHTASHADLGTDNLSAAILDKQIVASKSALEAQVGQTVEDFCYPSGKYNTTSLAKVKAAGFKTATTVHSGTVKTGDKYLELPRLRISDTTNLANLLK